MNLDIVLITYNQAQYIDQAMESILMQQFDKDIDVRVIVADDCSIDNTLDKIKFYEEKSPFPFEYLLTEQNMGVAANYKRAFNATSADFVAVIEGDDWWCDTCRLQKHIDYLSTHTNCVLTKNNYMQYSQRDNQWNVEQSIWKILTLKNMLQKYVLANMSCTVFRGDRIRNMDERVYEFGHNQWREATDWYTHMFVLQYGYGYVLDDVMSVYRIDTGQNISRTVRTGAEHIEKARLCYLQTLDLIGETFYNECKQLYLDAINCTKSDLANRRYQKWSNVFPPCLVSFTCYYLPKIWLCIKHCIWSFIPNGIYKKIRGK